MPLRCPHRSGVDPDRLTAVLRRKRRCAELLRSPLLELRRNIAEEIGRLNLQPRPVSEVDIGLAVWVVPSWYWRLALGGHPTFELITSFTSSLRYGWPKLKRAAEIRLSDQRKPSHVWWSLKKGLPGLTIHDTSATSVQVIVHADQWKFSSSEDAMKREFEEMSPQSRLGHTLKEISELSRRHGTALGCRLDRDGDAQAFGCLTAHTRPEIRLCRQEWDEVAKLLVAGANRISDVILASLF